MSTLDKLGLLAVLIFEIVAPLRLVHAITLSWWKVASPLWVFCLLAMALAALFRLFGIKRRYDRV